MGVIRFVTSGDERLAVKEFNAVADLYPKDASFLAARLARVARLGADEADDDRIVGADRFCWFQRGHAGVVYTVTAVHSGADVLVLTFADLKAESFPVSLKRGQQRCS